MLIGQGRVHFVTCLVWAGSKEKQDESAAIGVRAVQRVLGPVSSGAEFKSFREKEQVTGKE